MESKLEQYSKGSKGNRRKDSEQTINSAKEKKKKWALRNCNCYPFLQYLQIVLIFLVLSSNQYRPQLVSPALFWKLKKRVPLFSEKNVLIVFI